MAVLITVEQLLTLKSFIVNCACCAVVLVVSSSGVNFSRAQEYKLNHLARNFQPNMSLSHSVAADGTHIFYNPIVGKYLYLSSGSQVNVSAELPSIYSRLPSNSISAIIGTIKLKVNKYVILATQHEVTGFILNNPIARITGYKIFPLGSKTTSEFAKEEATYLSLLKQHLDNATLYFSLDNKYDLTNSLQRQYTSKGLTYDSRFWWNLYLSLDFLDNGGASFVSPIIYGYFKSFQGKFQGRSLEFALLTRRSIQRAGTRYFRRGADEDGNVANFNETEQLVTTLSDNQIYSLLQTRGSVPIFWSEINNLKYKPNLVVLSKSSLDATEKHFAEQTQLYGENYCVNLVNHSGYEFPVKAGYEAAVENLPLPLKDKVHYIYFDFHHECRKMQWHRVDLLLNHLGDLDYHDTNFFQFDLNTSQIRSVQDKIVRTNCMDCLDRTNVVQSTIARAVMKQQLKQSSYSTEWDKEFNVHFQSFWADNADAVSCAYSGTGALKTDFTRTGRRTKTGALNDLVNSITRYYKNNYADGTRQDSYDLFLGHYRPYQESTASPFVDNRPPYVQLLPYLVGTSLLVLLAIVLFPRGNITDIKNLLVIGGCLLFSANSLRFVNEHGYQFVNWPKLAALDFLAKGARSDGKVVYQELANYKRVGKKRT